MINNRTIKIGKKIFEVGSKTLIMGILNVTPDSFSDGGQHKSVDAAVDYAMQMIADGADIIDIGGESTRPGAEPISAKEELARVIPVIEKLSKLTDVPISIDTYKAVVAEAALVAGASMVNDVWGLKGDDAMADVVARYKANVCIMHNRLDTNYGENFLLDVLFDLKASLAIAEESGIGSNKIIVDPGIGFAKSYEQNLLLLKDIYKLERLDMPILIGASRKSVIARTVGEDMPNRELGTLAITALAAKSRAFIVRVHDVKSNRIVADMVDKIAR